MSTSAETPADKPQRLRNALREARIESAERSAVVVDLHDAEVARLEILSEALDPIFAELPDGSELFDRGLSRGEHPKLWIDMIAHISMGRDKRTYRFLADTRGGPIVLAESTEIEPIVEAVAKYMARRMIERERALASDRAGRHLLAPETRRRGGAVMAFVGGLLIGIIAVFALAAFVALRH
jgi:hypothetical protein